MSPLQWRGTGHAPSQSKVPLCGGVAAMPPGWSLPGHTLPLSLRRSTINVGNVGVRLWQSSAICLRAFARSAFLFTGSPRFARDDNGGGKWVFLNSLTTPALRATPPMEGNLFRAGTGASSLLQRDGDASSPAKIQFSWVISRRGGYCTQPPPCVARNDKNKYSLYSVLCSLFSVL